MLNLPTNSRFKAADIIDYGGVPTLGLWPGYSWINDSPIQIVVATALNAGRLDLIANQYLGDVELWWAIMYYNGVSDINWPRAGDEIKIPSLSSILNSKR